MAKTVTIDGAQLREVRVVVGPNSQIAVQASFALLSGTTLVQEVCLTDLTTKMQSIEIAGANALVTAMNGVLSRVELT